MRSGRCSFDQFSSTIDNLWWTRDALNIITSCQSRWVWFRASELDVCPHLLERAGFESHGLPKKTIERPPVMQMAQAREDHRRHKILQWMRLLRVPAKEDVELS